MEELDSSLCNLGILDTLKDDSIQEIIDSYNGFFSTTNALLNGSHSLALEMDFASQVHTLCKHGLHSLVTDHFLKSLEICFETNGVAKFWSSFDAYSDAASNRAPDYEDNEMQRVLCSALEDISCVKEYQEKVLLVLVNAICSNVVEGGSDSDAERRYLFSRYQLMVSSVLMASLPRHFPEMLHWYFKGRLEELSSIMDDDINGDDNHADENYMDLDERGKMLSTSGEMDIDELHGKLNETNMLVKTLGNVVRDLRNLGFTSMTEDAYASAIFLLLKAKVHDLAGDDYRTSVLGSIKEWIQAVPIQFLHAFLAYLGDSISCTSPSPGPKSPLISNPATCYAGKNIHSEGLTRWQLRLEYFAYETLQDLRIAKLFEIIVDYPDSTPAIEDLKQCLEYTGQHSKLVESFISALKYRLLTAGASTNDILHQYVSTIKALRTIDPAGVFLEAVGEPIRDYLRGRKDTIKCIVTMLTDGTGGNSNGSGISGDSLLEELKDEEGQENVDADDDFNTDDKQAWINAACWEPDPVEADPLKGSRNQRKVDILGMIVGIIGSKDQLVNEYRVMLAEKLLNKSDYDIDSEIRTLELLKIHFGESSMQKCEIMLNDLTDSKRTNQNIKATMKTSQKSPKSQEMGASLDILDTTIISSNFWPPIQILAAPDPLEILLYISALSASLAFYPLLVKSATLEEALNLPEPVDQLLTDYANRFHEIKTPRKLLWKKNLGTVKLELQFEDRAVQFTVTPVHAAIIMQFQEQTRWTSNKLAGAIGIPVDILNRRIYFWINKGIIAESLGKDSDDHVFTLVEGMADASKTGGSTYEELPPGDDEGERSVASVEHKEMTVYEKFIMGMLTNFGSMALDRIHNTLKMFCIADPPYDKSLQQLQNFLSGLVSEEKLELRDGMYYLKK